jgi:hypothetical protein
MKLLLQFALSLLTQQHSNMQHSTAQRSRVHGSITGPALHCRRKAVMGKELDALPQAILNTRGGVGAPDTASMMHIKLVSWYMDGLPC